MRIEEVNKTKLSKALDKELLILKLRFTQLWDKNFLKNDFAVVGSLDRNQFLKNYKLLLNELNSRHIEKSTSDIDKAVFKKLMIANKYGVDVSDCEEIMLAEDYIVIEADGIDVKKLTAIIKAAQLGIVEGIEDCIEPVKAYIPLYDLVLKAKKETTIIEVLKPYPNEHSARLQDPDKFDPKSFRRTKGGLLYGSKKLPKTIDVIWGKLKDKSKPTDPPIPQALRFPTSDWTVTKAKKWLKDNEIKVVLFEPAKKVTKKLLKEQTETVKEDTVQFDKFVSVYPMGKADSDEHIVCGVVYEPDEEDAQGDMANEIEIRKAAYQFMEQIQKFKVMHKGKIVKVKVLESYIAPADFTIAKQEVKKGTWLITVRVLDKKIWKAVKDGELTGFSMAGYAKTA